VVAIIEALGQVEFATLRENAVAFGLSGRGGLTLDQIFTTTWRIWRDAGVLTTSPPEATPLDTDVVASLARANPAIANEAPHRSAAPTPTQRPDVLIVIRDHASKVDNDAWIAHIGFLAAVFNRLPLRISIKDDAKATQLIADTARERFNLPASQVVVAKTTRASTIEVLSQP
jgi:hypothetical protein